MGAGLLAALLALGGSPCAAGPARSVDVPKLPDTPIALGARLDAIAAEHGVLGYSVVGTRDGEVAVSHSGGTAVVAAGRPVVEETAFRMASVSKVTAAIALMQQWEEGKFGLDEDISEVLGFVVRNPAHPRQPVTYRQLLSHTSGLKDDPAYFDFLNRSFSGKPPKLSTLRMGFTEKAPGEAYRYSNLGYGLIGALVEKHSGMRFGDYARERIFEPLGMQASFTASEFPGSVRRLAALYRYEKGRWVAQTDDFRGRRPRSLVPDDYVPGDNGIVQAPHGGMRTSVLDLSRLLRALRQGGSFEGARILKKKTVRLMSEVQKVVKITQRELYAVGLGLHLISPYARDGGLWIGHSGVASGLHSDLYFEDAGRYGVVFAANGVKPPKPGQHPEAFRRDIAAAVLHYMRRTE